MEDTQPSLVDNQTIKPYFQEISCETLAKSACDFGLIDDAELHLVEEVQDDQMIIW